MKTKEIVLPEGWEVKEVVGNRIILREKETELPKTWEECARIVNDVELINIDSEVESYAIDDFDEGPIDAERKILPVGMGKPMLAFCQLLICRNAWWQKLGWKPDWKDQNQMRYCIGLFRGKVGTSTNEVSNRILAFPLEEIRDQFLESFRDLIEEAKELL